jgi:amino acid adenylation domain-containing protein
MFHEQDHYRLGPNSRIYDFSSYGFIVSIANNLNALCTGACVCVPNEDDKRNRLAESISALRANVIHLTPSTARLLAPSDIPGIEFAVFSGEGLHSDDIKTWWGKVRILNVYGQSECAPRATINFSAATPQEVTRIGKGLGQRTWVVDPQNHDQLVPIGCVGELLLEGPQVGCGYLDEPERTAVAFIHDPVWLLKGAPGRSGRHGRLYKTGDLVQSTEDGTLTLVGRKDAQVKIRGQRVELGEVEHRVHECIPEAEQISAEIITPTGQGANPLLAIFLTTTKSNGGSEGAEAVSSIAKLYPVASDVEERLRQSLPIYMVPSIFFTLPELPRTTTNKINRRRLREIGSSFSVQQLADMRTVADGPKRQPQSPMEIRLQSLWSQVLNISPSSIGLDDSFINLGGDSIAAMKLVAEARQVGIAASVADILSHPTLEKVADHTLFAEQEVVEEILPFSLLDGGNEVSSTVEDIAKICDLQSSDIEDVYPCTPLQEGLFSLSSKQGDYIAQCTLELAPGIDLRRFRNAWETVQEELLILRTRIATHKGDNLLQVVVKPRNHWTETSGLADYLATDRAKPMTIGQPLSRYALIKDEMGVVRWFTLTIHHALYDGWSLPLIFKAVTESYQGVTLSAAPRFNVFIKHITAKNKDDAERYWRDYLGDYNNAPFPALPPAVHLPLTDTVTDWSIALKQRTSKSVSNITMSSLVRGAWALVVGCMTTSDDIVFGMPVSGRNAPVVGIDRIAAPTLATVPVRVRWKPDWSVNQYLQAVHEEAISMIPYEQTGLRQIASYGGQVASNFQTLLLVQPKIEGPKSEALGMWTGINDQELSTYGMMLEIQLDTASIFVRASFDSRVIQPWIVRRLLQKFDSILQQLLEGTGDQTIASINIITKQELETIWGWNSTLPATVDRHVHSLIEDHAHEHPNRLAICAWDGELTYGDLDQKATSLAWKLADEGVQPDTIVPLCFEKSMWTTVAMLAVLKAGGAFVLLDPALPEQRLATVVQQVNSRMILCSRRNLHIASSLVSNALVVDREFFESQEGRFSRLPITSSPDSRMYVVFTSGSTGTPKGVMLSHRNFASAVYHQKKYYQLDHNSRVYDFASHSFDVAILNPFNTLASGACLCVPSDQERKDDLANSIKSYKATLIELTPSVARLLSPRDLPDLKVLLFGGETLQSKDVHIWWGKIRILNTYGPSECTPNGTMNDCTSTPEAALRIGKGAGQITWLVDPDDHNRLVPPGCSGELLLEGPLVGLGYLNEPSKTASAFVENPAWLTRGSPTVTGRHGRLYKTGDLAQYNEDGSLTFIGRKDMQVKIRGQRVELGEIETHIWGTIKSAEQVVAEVIIPQGIGASPTLAAFLQIKDEIVADVSDDQDLQIFSIDSDVHQQLSAKLPAYMVPTLFFKMGKLPVTASAKIDRKRIREIGASFSAKKLAEMQTAHRGLKRQPRNVAEKALQKAWGLVIGIDPHDIGLDDGFFQLGGDSISAMKLVGAAQDNGVSLVASDVFRCPKLESLAKEVSLRTNTILKEIPPFALLDTRYNVTTTIKDVADVCQLDPALIQDVYPCTPLQQGLLSLSSKQSGDYVSQMTLELRPDVSVDAWRRAWEQVVHQTDTLRTRIVQHSHAGALQVVIKESINWIRASGLTKYQESDRKRSMGPGQPLTRYALVKDEFNTVRWFTWTIHHCLYDGWSMALILDAVKRAYHGNGAQTVPNFNRFIKFINDQDENSSRAYWRKTFAGYDNTPFPSLLPSVLQPEADASADISITLCPSAFSDITTSVLVRAAWALVTGCWSSSDDVVFGAPVSGRNAPVESVNEMLAPTIATVPLRIRWETHWTILDYLHRVNQQAIEMIPFEQTGLHRIAKVSPEAQQGCKFQSLLVIQPREDSTQMDSFGHWQEYAYRWSGTYALIVHVHTDPDHIEVKADFDSRLIEPWIAQKLLEQLDSVIQQLSQANDMQPLSDVTYLTQRDYNTIWGWNGKVPAQAETFVQHTIEKIAAEQPHAPAICAWDASLSYEELDRLSMTLASTLLDAGVGPGVLVPMCFEKSSWAVVTMLAILKAGGGLVQLDPSLPLQRLQTIIEQANASLVVTSASCADIGNQLAENVIIVDEALVGDSGDGSTQKVINPSADSVAYVIFTSGSTGTPKGVLVSHSNLASAIRHQAEPYGFNKNTRMYNFSSPSFDASVVEILFTLGLKGCVCIPSDKERRDDLAGSFQRLKANTLMLTPSVTNTLNPEDFTGLQLLIWMGEALHPKDVNPWWGKLRAINVYGPSECTPVSTMSFNTESPDEISRIGRGVGQLTWVVEPSDHNRLVPTGCVGELLLEGPLVGRGYLKDPERTAASFIKNPKWLLQGRPGELGRHGSLYKTGDLVRYNEDGSLVFVARKDTQVKLRGQRVELREVEYYTKKFTTGAKQVVSEVIRPSGESARPLLAAFIQTEGSEPEPGESDTAALELTLKSFTSEIEDELAEHLPRYMVPSVFFTIRDFPLVTSGKINRKLLRELGSSFTVEQLAEIQASRREPRREPQTQIEKILQRIWSQVLDIKISNIGLDDSFFKLGGDSIIAMNLVSEARRSGIQLSVADIFRNPKLEQIVKAAIYLQHQHNCELVPFSLLPKHVDLPSLVEEAASQCAVAKSEIQDLYPCTQLQEGLFSLSTKQGDYVSQFVLDISPDVDISRLCESWEICVREIAILRTRIISSAKDGVFQAVLDEPLSWIKASNLKDYLQTDRKVPVETGQRLSRFALVTNERGSGSIRWFAWTMHHALYDAWSMSLILSRFKNIYYGQLPNPLPQFNTFIKYIISQDQNEVNAYWQKSLKDYVHTPFPAASLSTDVLVTDAVAHRHIVLQHDWSSDITASTLVPAAWGLLTGYMTNTTDVTLGTISSGRSASVIGLDEIVGPTVATFPVRVKWTEDLKVHEFLESLHQQRIDMIPFEQTGLQNIAKLSHDAEQACSFQTLLVMQPPDIDEQQADFGTWIDAEKQWYNTYPLTVFVQLGTRDIITKARYDPRVVEPWMTNKLLEQFESLIHQLYESRNHDKSLSEIEKVTASDLATIWDWNNVASTSVNKLAHDMLDEQAAKRPDSQAVCAWDGELTYRALSDMATHLASYLAEAGVGPGVVVPLCFGKSMWNVVSLFAVLKAGGAFLLVDQSLPDKRLESMIQQVGADLILSSTNYQVRSKRLGKSVIVVNEELFRDSKLVPSCQRLAEPTPDSLMYIVFTSGSTGTPKGLRISHQNFASAIHYQREYYGYDGDTRFYDFASFSFDMSVFSIVFPLACGSCVCVPNDEERKTNLAGSIRSFNADSLALTPPVSKLLDPSEIPSVKRVILSGEALHVNEASKWWGKVQLLNCYGPAECTPISTVNHRASTPDESVLLGHGAGLSTWVTYPDDPSSLVPIGGIGELLLEGPLVGMGYLNEEQTAEVFISPPTWLLKGSNNGAGRSGRLYKTGDLVKYTKDGNLIFVGRKSTMAKIRGQRVDLGEVEYQLKQHIPAVKQVIAEIFTPKGEGAEPVLAAFLQLDGSSSNTISTQEFSADIYSISSSIEDRLAEYLPRYMLPGVLFSVQQFPLTPSLKTNRAQLRQFGQSITVQELAKWQTAGQGPKRRPETLAELQLQRLWSDILHIAPEIIGVDDSFFQLGGDSIGAMRLIGAARKMGVNLSMVDVFRYTRLEQMASLCVKVDSSTEVSADSSTSTLINSTQRQELLDELDTLQFSIRSSDVADVVTLNDFQSNLVKAATKTPQIFYNYFCVELGPSPDIPRLMHRIYRIIEAMPILRARFLPLLGSHWQVIPHHLDLPFQIHKVDGEWEDEFSSACLKDLNVANPTDYPFRAILLRNGANDSRLVLRLSHSQYDGISLASIFRFIVEASEDAIAVATQNYTFKDYLTYADSRRSVSRAYWKELLRGSSITSISSHLPAMPQPTSPWKPIGITKYISISTTENKVTQAALLSSAWAALLARLANIHDVSYSQLVAGRNSSISGIEDIVGPCINIIPVRAVFSPHTTAAELLRSVQDQFISMGEADSLGMKDISANCTDWPSNEVMDSVIQHQNINENPDIQGSTLQIFKNPYLIQSKVWVTTRPQKGGIDVEFQSNTHMMTQSTAEILLENYCKIATALADKPQATLLSLINELDINFDAVMAAQ